MSKTVEEVKNIKERLLPEIRKITAPQHARGEEIVAKFSRYDDCFAVGFKADTDACRSCTLLMMYEGKEIPANELCKKFMEIPLFEKTPTPEKEKSMPEEKKSSEAAATADAKPAKEKKAKVPKEKKPKAEGEASVSKEERRAQITAAIKKGANSLPALLALPEFKGVSVNYFLHPMVKEGLVTREKDGHGYKYGIK